MLALALALAAAVAAAPVTPDPAEAQLARLEHQWGEAFVQRDFAFIERIVAPEFRLVVAQPDGRVDIIRRKDWMKHTRDWTHHAFAVEVVDVNRVGDTAIVSAQGLWTVTMQPGTPPQPIRFVATDTWVRRHGQWQVVHRYSHRLPAAAWPPAAPVKPPAQ